MNHNTFFSLYPNEEKHFFIKKIFWSFQFFHNFVTCKKRISTFLHKIGYFLAKNVKLHISIFLFIKVFTPYLDAEKGSQPFVMPIIPELFKVQKFSLNEIYKNSWVGPIENCQTNRFLTIWQNIIFGRKFMARGTQNHNNQEFDGSSPFS